MARSDARRPAAQRRCAKYAASPTSDRVGRCGRDAGDAHRGHRGLQHRVLQTPMWRAPAPCYGRPRFWKRLREREGCWIEAGCKVSESPGLRLASFFREHIQHAAGEPPPNRTTDATALRPRAEAWTLSALGRGMPSIRVRLAPVAQQASERERERQGDTGGWLVRRMA